jgi:hypothetical protein
MTQEEHLQGSAAVALRRLSHPGRDGGFVRCAMPTVGVPSSSAALPNVGEGR